jgi:regulatory protein
LFFPHIDPMKKAFPQQFPDRTHPARTRALACAFRILARRDHTSQELTAKLRDRGFHATVIAHALERCRDLGYLDDAKTAMIMAGRLTEKGYGPLRIRRTLGQKGLADALIEKALACCGDEETQVHHARRLLEKRRLRLRRQPDPIKRRQMAYRILSGRGFSSSVVRQAIEDG